MSSFLYAALGLLAAAGLFFAAVVWFCVYMAKSVLHPAVKRTLPDAWPDQYGMPYENVFFKTEDKVQLQGWFIPGAEYSHKTVIFMHDWGQNRAEMLKNTYFLRDLGFNLFYFDFRAQGESGGKTSSMGYLELKDISAAVRFLRDTRPQFCEKIGLYGLSLGAVAALGEAARNLSVSCVAAEGAYYSYRRAVSRWVWLRRRVPYFPLVPVILRCIRKRLGVNPERYSPQYNISKIAPRPVLIIHGRYDNWVPAVQAKLLYKKAGNPKEIWLVPGAGHNQCAEVGGFEYKQRLADFFRQHL